MRQFSNILKKNGLEVLKYTIRGRATIVKTPLGQFVFKKNNGCDIYKYLSSRNFEYFPKIIDFDNDNIMYEYLEDIDYDKEQRAFDIIHLISLLHSKTTYYKEINYDEYKKIYEEYKNKINYMNNYYLDLIGQIESKIYMSPYEYLVARNISKILSCFNYCNIEIDKWYDLVKDKKRKRVVTLHNNLKLDNLIKNKHIYLISWDKFKIDFPIYDLVDFYNLYSLDFDFISLFSEYERIFPLLEEEKILLNVLISIPNKIPYSSNEFDMINYTRRLIDKIYKTENILASKEKEERKDTKK